MRASPFRDAERTRSAGKRTPARRRVRTARNGSTRRRRGPSCCDLPLTTAAVGVPGRFPDLCRTRRATGWDGRGESIELTSALFGGNCTTLRAGCQSYLRGGRFLLSLRAGRRIHHQTPQASKKDAHFGNRTSFTAVLEAVEQRFDDCSAFACKKSVFAC